MARPAGRVPHLRVDLAADEEAIFGGDDERLPARDQQGEKVGVRVEQAHGVEFADEYHAQLVEVFARSGPPAAVRRRAGPRADPLPRAERQPALLRAVAPDGERIATGIFPALRRLRLLLGRRELRRAPVPAPQRGDLLARDAVLPRARRRRLDLGGGGDYKRKYGATEKRIPYVRKSRVPGLLSLRDLAAYVYKRRAMRGQRRPLPRNPGGAMRSA